MSGVPEVTPPDPAPFPSPSLIIEPERPPSSAFWSWSDIVLFIGFGGLSFLITLLGISFSHTRHLLAPATELVLGQCLLYLLLITALCIIIRIRYGRPFWPSMGFGSVQPTWLSYVVAGMFLAIAIGLLGRALKAPEIPLPFQDMLRSRSAVISLGILVVVLGPFCEELVFRGFLMPLFIRSLGAAAGIVLAGVLFGALHGFEYLWQWQQVVLISAVGIIFGWARYRTGSNFPAVFLHAGFNLTQFAALIYTTNTK